MALALDIIFVILVIISTKTVDLQPRTTDITEILKKVMEQIEVARRNMEPHENPIDTTARNDSQIFYMKSKSDPNNLQEMAKTLPETIDEFEGKSPIVPGLPQNVDFAENTNSEDGQPLVNIIETDDSTINSKTLDEIISPVDEKISSPSRRTANLETDDTNQPTIIDQIMYDDRSSDKYSQNPHIDTLASTTDYFTATTESSVNKINENFEKLFKKIREIKKLHTKDHDDKFNDLEPQYRSTLDQVDGKMANKPFSERTQMVPRFQEHFIIQRTPASNLQQPYPQNKLIKAPSFLRQNRAQIYPNYIHQLQPAILPRTQRVILRQVPTLVDKIPKFYGPFNKIIF